MWALLSDPGHVTRFDELGEVYTPLRRLVEQLTTREYANRVFAYKWMSSFNLTVAPTSQEIAEHDQVGIEYVPDQGVFRVSYNERLRPERLLGVRTTPSRVCTPQEVEKVADCFARRLLLSPPPKPERAGALGVIAFAMIASIVLFVVCWALAWAGVMLETLTLASMGLMSLSASLFQLGMAWNPNWLWLGGQWSLRGREMGGPPDWLISLGGGICFGSLGLLFLVFAIFGRDVVTLYTAFAAVGSFALGVGLALVGNRHSRGQMEVFRVLHRALTEYAEGHDGWFPKGEVCPEASLSLLHRENPALVTADVLRGRAVSEFTVTSRLESGQLLSPEACGWHYTEGLQKHDDPRLALFWDKTTGMSRFDAWLSDHGHFVYFLGGSVGYIPDTEWDEFLAEQEWLRAGIVR